MEFKSDFSTEDVTEIVDKQKLQDKVISSLESLLKRTHRDPRKQTIKITTKKIKFACPYCGDSTKNPNNHRGNIWTNSNIYRCFNYGCKAEKGKSLKDIIIDFGEKETFSKAELRALDTIGEYTPKSGYQQEILAYANHFTEYERYALSKELIYKTYNLTDITNFPKGLKTLKNRKVHNIHFDRIAADPKGNSIVFLNMNQSRTKVISFQRRVLYRTKSGNRYFTKNYTEIVTQDLGIKDADPKILALMDKIGSYYNILNVDFSKRVYVFEGTVDSLMLPNSLGMMSVGNDIIAPTFWYVFDDDWEAEKQGKINTGKLASFKKIDEGFYVFLWKKFKTDFPIYRYCKDMNDVFKEREVSLSILDNYFSNNPLHKLWI